MKLIYYQRNSNFGDALNPMIFNKFFEGFFDQDESSVFLGIGSIIQFQFPHAKQKIVFSTGYSYGRVPVIDASYDIACLRGPLTAEKLGLDKKLGITDGAALLKTFRFPDEEKKYSFSFMPHHESTKFFDWKRVCENVGYNFINPLDDPQAVISQILKSEVVITEAMHGAIAADTLRVPWIPVKFYKTISEFKWEDWTASLDMCYTPNRIQPIFNEVTIKEKIAAKFKSFPALKHPAICRGYSLYQDRFLIKNTMRKFSNLRYEKCYLSDEQVLDYKVEKLLNKIETVKNKYVPSLKKVTL